MYYIAGSYIALSLVHGGPGPNCFSHLLFNQLIDRPRHYNINHISDKVIKEKVKRVRIFLPINGLPHYYDKLINSFFARRQVYCTCC